MVGKDFFTGIECGEAFQISNWVEPWSSLIPDWGPNPLSCKKKIK